MIEIRQGHVLEVLASMAAGSVQMVMTSPPYWGLRTYPGVEVVWDAADGCEHEWGNVGPEHHPGQVPDGKSVHEENAAGQTAGSGRFCRLCGAWRGELGLEPTVDLYVQHIVEVFRAVRRVLRGDGTMWLNLGFSYFGGQQTGSHDSDGKESPDCQDDGCPVIHLCDACRASILTHTVHSDVRHALVSDVCEGVPILVHTESRCLCFGSSGLVDHLPNGLSNLSTPDRQQIAARVLALLGISLESMTPESWQPPPGECWHCDNCGACLSVLGSTSRESRVCARKADCTGGTVANASSSASRISDMAHSVYPYLHYTTTHQWKSKDLIPIPWLVAMALQADGWWLRSAIVWAKGVSFCPTYAGSVMPESCTDRPTSAYEMVFLLSKAKTYYYDAEAVREAAQYGRRQGGFRGDGGRYVNNAGFDNAADVGKAGTVGGPEDDPSAGRNLRNVWCINPQAFKEAHFATFPEKLVEPCVKAGSSPKACGVCGAPWEKVVDKHGGTTGKSWHDHTEDAEKGQHGEGRNIADGYESDYSVVITGWRPTCEHYDDLYREYPRVRRSRKRWQQDRADRWFVRARKRPGKDDWQWQQCVTLDPFSGTGTVGLVCKRLGRSYVGIELSPKYVEMSRNRLSKPVTREMFS